MLGSSVPIYLLVKSAETPASENNLSASKLPAALDAVHLDFVVDEIERAVQRGIEAGTHLEQPITHTRVGQACSDG